MIINNKNVISFQQILTLNNETYSLVQVQRDGLSAIYTNDHYTKYLRIGDTKKMEKDFRNHTHLFSQGYQVSEIIESGISNDCFYFIEKSLGKETFGAKFKKEFSLNSKISESSFDSLLDICKKHLITQIKNSSYEQNWESVYDGILLNLAIEELGELTDKFIEKFEYCKKRLSNLPFSFSHGDFGSYNILDNGIIDFEDGFSAPVIFDVLGLLVYDDWFPHDNDLEIRGGFHYNKEQVDKYLYELDKIMIENNLPKASDYYNEIYFLKGVWLMVAIHDFPKLQKVRYNMMNKILL